MLTKYECCKQQEIREKGEWTIRSVLDGVDGWIKMEKEWWFLSAHHSPPPPIRRQADSPGLFDLEIRLLAEPDTLSPFIAVMICWGNQDHHQQQQIHDRTCDEAVSWESRVQTAFKSDSLEMMQWSEWIRQKSWTEECWSLSTIIISRLLSRSPSSSCNHSHVTLSSSSLFSSS